MENINDNIPEQRFELEVEGAVAFAAYRREGPVVHILHVEAPPQLRGTGAAGRLMQGIMGHARGRGEKIYPVCSYAVSWLKRHKEYEDMLAE